MSIRTKLMLAVSVGLILIVASCVGVAAYQFSHYVDKTTVRDAENNLQGFAAEMKLTTQNALERTKGFAVNPSVVVALSSRDAKALSAVLEPMIKDSGLDFVTVTDTDGIVLLRSYDPEKSGDSVAKQANVAAALKGTAAAFVESGTEIKLAARAGVPVKDAAGKMLGVLSGGYRLDKPDFVERVKKMYGSECTIFLGDKRLMTTIMLDGKRVVGTPLDPEITKIVLTEGKSFNGRTTILGNPFIASYMPLRAPDGKAMGILFAGRSLQEANSAMSRSAWEMGLLGLVVLVLSAIALFFFVRSITGPLQVAVGQLGQLSQGDFSIRVSQVFLKRKDEIGLLSRALDGLTQSMSQLIQKISTSTEQVASSSEELTASAQQSADASGSIAASIQQVAEGSEKQVSAVNETSAIVQEISATMEEMSATATEMATMSEQTASAAIEGKTSVDRAVGQMTEVSVGAKQAQTAAEELKASSAQIGEIVGLISTIAGQTNLLALNAAIEAARAGEQGRGFAVVAEEVRKLAEQSEQAAQEIKGLVSSNHDRIDKVVGAIDVAIRDISQGVELVNVAGTNFGAINEQVGKVTDQVRIIVKAINEAAIGSQRIVSSIKEVESLSRDAAAEAQTVSAATEEQSASMEEIAASSQLLAKLAQELQEEVSKFRI